MAVPVGGPAALHGGDANCARQSSSDPPPRSPARFRPLPLALALPTPLLLPLKPLPPACPSLRFVSSAPDRNGFHSLIQDAFDERMRSGRHEVASWSIPFLSTVTLIERHGPGEWEVYPTKYGLRPSKRGLRVQQTRYTVTVSFG